MMIARDLMSVARAMVIVAAAGLSGLSLCLAADAQVFPVPLDLWDRPRSGRTVMALAPVRDAMNALVTRPQAKLLIRHRSGVEAGLQAEELKAWLVAHAVEPGRIVLRSDPAAGRALQLEVMLEPKP